MSATWRRVLAGATTLLVTLYAMMASVHLYMAYVPWMASWVETTPWMLFPFVLIAVFVLTVLPVVVLAVGALSLHWLLCRWFGARFDY